MWKAFLDLLPRGYGLPEQDWQRRHRLVLWVLSAHVPGLAVLAAALGRGLTEVLLAPAAPLVCLVLGILLRRHRRGASVAATAGLVCSSAALVVITQGSIEAHFHFFIIIGFIALYQDWIPFLFNILFTLISHGVGSAFQRTLIFDHPDAQANPWLWSFIHAVAVLIASVGMLLFWRITEESQEEKDALARELAQTEIGRRQFTSDLLVNLARRNQGCSTASSTSSTSSRSPSGIPTRSPSCSGSTTSPPGSAATPRACSSCPGSSRPARGASRSRCGTCCAPRSRRPRTSTGW
jgi:hypothetical protein